MSESRTAKNMMIIVVASALMTLFTYIFVDHHLNTPDKVQQDRSSLLSNPGAAERR